MHSNCEFSRPRTFTSVEISVMLNALFESISLTGSANKSLHLKQNQLRATAVKKDKYL
jgi:hypothetical protein